MTNDDQESNFSQFENQLIPVPTSLDSNFDTIAQFRYKSKSKHYL